uniref:Tc1-like transposase DDE domain-containing protein n=1 Tax=Esox lucius TaxID=8010 RepID=A0AAY5K3T2_ESOLU
MSLNNRRMKSSDLQKEWQTAAVVKCTVRTVRNRLLGAGQKSCKAIKKPFINEKQRRARLIFAKDHNDWTVEEWSKDIFSDESNFHLFPTPGRLMVRRRPREAYKPQCLALTMKFGNGLWMLQQGWNLADLYKVILEEHILPNCSPTLRIVFSSRTYHTARSINLWMEDHQIKTLSWPAQSPDLNLIENLWNLIKRNMDGHKP